MIVSYFVEYFQFFDEHPRGRESRFLLFGFVASFLRVCRFILFLMDLLEFQFIKRRGNFYCQIAVNFKEK